MVVPLHFSAWRRKKIIRERIGHKSNVLFRYEEASEATLSDFTSVGFSAQDKIVCSKSTICTSTNVVEDEKVFSTMVSSERLCNGINF